MKRMLALLAALLMIGGVAFAAVDYTGSWVLSSVRYNGIPFDPADFGMDMTVLLNADGSCSVVGVDDQSLGSWEAIDGGVAVSVPSGTSMTLRYRFGKLYSDAVNGVSLVFSRGASAPRVPGDADNNGRVNLADAVTVLAFASGDIGVIHLSNANVNGDYVVDTRDALLILQYVAGWSVTLQ